MSAHVVEYENLKKSNAPFFEEYNTTFQRVMGSGWYILGKEVLAFEKAFAEYNNVPHCVGVASGLDALILALMALDLPPQSEVIVASNAYIACIISIVKAGLKPILVEPSEKNSNIDIEKIEANITEKTKVIMPVHMYGYPCDMGRITALAKKYNLFVVEDCAQAHGAKYCDQTIGSLSTLAAFSFYPTKNLGALGDAGAIVTHDEALANKLRALRNYGSHIKYHNDYIGINSRLDEMQAAFLNIKLKHLDKINAHKRKLARIYDENLDEKYRKPKHEVGFFGVYHIYNIYHENRDQLKDYLKEHGISTEIHYPISPIKQNALKGMFLPENFLLTEKMHAMNLSLPIAYFHTEQDILYVCQKMNDFIREEKR